MRSSADIHVQLLIVSNTFQIKCVRDRDCFSQLYRFTYFIGNLGLLTLTLEQKHVNKVRYNSVWLIRAPVIRAWVLYCATAPPARHGALSNFTPTCYFDSLYHPNVRNEARAIDFPFDADDTPESTFNPLRCCRGTRDMDAESWRRPEQSGPHGASISKVLGRARYRASGVRQERLRGWRWTTSERRRWGQCIHSKPIPFIPVGGRPLDWLYGIHE